MNIIDSVINEVYIPGDFNIVDFNIAQRGVIGISFLIFCLFIALGKFLELEEDISKYSSTPSNITRLASLNKTFFFKKPSNFCERTVFISKKF